MHRLLIVDDEPYVVSWLYELFSSLNELELDVVRAYSGEEALEIMKQVRIDIVLTDIKMPGICGMQLLNTIRAKWTNCRVIFLTGHDEFELAYKAIEKGVVDFILKTESDDRIIKAVEKAVASIENEYRASNLLHKAEQQMETLRPLMQKEFMQYLLAGEIPQMNIMQQRFDEFRIPLSASMPCIMLLCRIDSDDEKKAADVLERVRRNLSMYLIIESKLSLMSKCYSFQVDRFELLSLLQPVNTNLNYNEEYNILAAFIGEMLEDIQNTFRITLKLKVSFALSCESCTWKELGGRYNLLKLLLEFHKAGSSEVIVTDKVGVLPNQEAGHKGITNSAIHRDRIISTIKEYIENGNKRGCLQMLDQCAAIIDNSRNMSFYSSNEFYFSISILLLSYINRWNLNEAVDFKVGLNRLIRLDEFKSWEEAFAYLKEVAEAIFDTIFLEQEKQLVQTVTRVCKYIEENLAGDLSLMNLSALVNYNPSYLSRIFHKITGMTISQYIRNVRLNRIKEFLRNADIKLNEIAAMTGFESPAYFSRFFKKMVGIAPHQYRDIELNKKKM